MGEIDIWINLTNRYRFNGKIGKAVNFLSEKIQKFPSSPKLWSALATAYNQNKEYTQAIKASRKALELAEGYPEALDNLFFAYDQMKDHEQTLEIIKQYKTLHYKQLEEPPEENFLTDFKNYDPKMQVGFIKNIRIK